MAKSVWALDKAHSEVDFSVKHMMFATVRGTFKEFSANIVADPEDLTTADITFEVDTNSVDTRDEGRDGHLRGEDFFDSAKYPKMTFKSTKIESKGGGNYKLIGDLTMRDVTHPVEFNVEFEGIGKDPWGNEKAGFSAVGSLNRKDFGLVWNAALETGGVLVSDQVKIEIHLQAAKQA